jgi:glycosyltransferase involved in cell wall biosynthesis
MNKIIIDAQILQTPARDRGMGQYLVSVIKALATTKSRTIDLILSSSKKIDKFEEDIFKEYKNIRLTRLPLACRADIKDTQRALENNKKVVDTWLEENGISEATYMIGSLFQMQIYPVFPSMPGIQKMLICYDAIPLQRFQEYAPKMHWKDYLSRHSEYYKADTYLCISETVANDIQIYTSVSPEKIQIINGSSNDASEILQPKVPPKSKYIFMPTGNDLRKNNQRAIEAFERYRLENDHTLYLVISSFFTDTEKEILSRLSPNIIFTGSVSSREVNWYYKNCEIVLFPSTYEGLGMPIIEAMHFDKIIAASFIEVFREITTEGITFFNPYNTASIMTSIKLAMETPMDEAHKKIYKRVIEKYTWENTAMAIQKAVDPTKTENHITKPAVAVVGPKTTGLSAIGKVIAELHAESSSVFDIDYYYETSISDIELRPDILGNCTNYYPVQELTDRRAKQYAAIIYHIGNSNHHTITYARAIKNPSISVLHDLNIENIFDDLVNRKIIDEKRKFAERKLTTSERTNYTATLIKSQKKLITHSNYARKIIQDMGGNVESVQLPIDTPRHYKKKRNGQFTFGMAGIIAGIKGVETIEAIASHPDFINDRILIFGINFAEPGLLDRIMQMSNIEVTTNLSDFEFQEKLKELDVFINYRKKYQGEASQATLESMRWGIPVIVRGDFGWYAELPDDSVMKVESEEEAIKALARLRNDAALWQNISTAATEYTANKATQRRYVALLEKIVAEVKT